MRIKNLLKIVGFLIITIPFSGVACKQNIVSHETSLPTHTRSPKYLLSGELDTSNGDFLYYAINGGLEYAVALKESSRNSTAELTIPDEYSNKPVTGIWRSGFYECKSTKVNIPSSITVIDYEAFLGSRITSVSIPATVTAIGEGAFYSCKDLKKVTFQNSTASSASSACSCSEVTDDDDNQEVVHSTLRVIPSFCFFNCVAIKEIVLPEAIEEIEYEAFNGCLSMYSTLAFMNIKTIRSRAFQNCVSLRQIYISSAFFDEDENNEPAGVIEDHAFNNCSSSLYFHLSGDNDTITTWLNLSRNKYHWNQISESTDPQTASNQFNYEITSGGGASYSNDWIYTTDANNNVHITSYIGPTEIEGNPVEFLSFPSELPSGSGNYVRSFATDALVTVRANLKRIYLPKTLKRIDNNQFDANYTNLIVIDDNTTCSGDDTLVQQEENLTPRIVLNGLTDLEVIGNRAFLNMPKLNTITKLYLPYSLKVVGSRAFGTAESDGANKHMKKVIDFRWDYDDSNSALEVIGREAFYKLGKNDSSYSVTNTPHQGYYKNNNSTNNTNYQLATLVIPRTFQHFGVSSSDATTYSLSYSDGNDSVYAFAASPILSKVVFKGSLKSVVQGANASTVDSNVSDLILGPQTFVMNESLRTIAFEERVGKSIVFYTGAGDFKPVIGWSCGRASNDFGGDPTIQTIVLPNKYTTLVMQNHALQGNARAALYLSGNDSGDRLVGSIEANVSTLLTTPKKNSFAITDSRVEEWRTIGKENSYGYYFDSTKKNSFGLDQQMPVYANVLYKDTISVSGVSTEVEVGTGNTKEYVVDDTSQCAFVTGTANGEATMTNYLYDRYRASTAFNGTVKVPGVISNSANTNFSVTVIGDSAFSAAFCDTTSYANVSSHPDLSTISLPDSIVTIGDYAFMRAYGVTKITSHNASTGADNDPYAMPSSLRHIGKHAFAFCNVPKILNIPLDCLFYENENSTTNETSVFSNNFSLRQITFGSGATSSTYYTTTTYTTNRNGGGTFTSALYSKDVANITNPDTLLMVLNRDAGDSYATSQDLTDDIENGVHHGKFDGQYADYALYGAFKMCYWLDRLTIGIPTVNSLSIEQPLISGITSNIYLGNQIEDFTGYTCNLTTISFGDCELSDVPSYAFSGCENLIKVELPRRVGETIPEGLFSFITNENMQFVVPYEVDGVMTTKTCPVGVLDLTYTGYVGIDANAFKGSSIHTLIAPITSTFTIESDAFANTSLTSVNFSNVTDRVVLDGCFRGATIASSSTFTYNNTAKVEFGDETFKEATFTDKTFVFPAKTAIIGTSCFESCTTLENVSAAGVLNDLELVASDSASGLNNDGTDNLASSFKQIGDYAFYMCTNLKNFDFTNFSTITRIGHFAFSMGKLKDGIIAHETDPGTYNNAIICTGGNINLPPSITNLGVGAFFGSAIVNVTINSSALKFERGRNLTDSTRAQASRGCFTFRYCKKLKNVYFSDHDCDWNTLYLPKQKGKDSVYDQSNIFSNCTVLEKLYLPSTYDIQYFDNQDVATARPDSMIWGSNNNVKVYLYKTLNDIIPNYHHGVCIYWHRTTSQLYKNLTYFVGNNLDVADNNNGVYSMKSTASDNYFWAVINGVDTFLGSAQSVDSSTGIVTFSGGYKADSTHVYAA